MSNIAIIGASIAGRITTILLKRLGISVKTFERAKDIDYPDHGAGIWLPPTLIADLIKRKILPPHFPSLAIQHRPIITGNIKDNSEVEITSHPAQAAAVHWLDLHNALKTSTPPGVVQYQTSITAVEQSGDGVVLTLNNEEKMKFDYCIFADGGQSIGRKYLFPSLEPTFVNTYIWRGILDKATIVDAQCILTNGSFYVNKRGHMLIYPVPNRASDKPLEDFKINWLFYEHVDPAHPLFAKDHHSALQKIAKGEMPVHYQDYLRRMAEKYLPAFPLHIIKQTPNPFTQPMYEMLIPQYVNNRIALIGDASIMLRPHTAAGSTKAIYDALALETALQQHLDVGMALEKWNKERHPWGAKEFELGKQLGKYFVTDVPNWEQETKASVDAKWTDLIANGACWYASK